MYLLMLAFAAFGLVVFCYVVYFMLGWQNQLTTNKVWSGFGYTFTLNITKNKTFNFKIEKPSRA